MTSRQRYALLALAVLWLALRVPHFGARYSFDWDSSQFARGMAEFDIARHQPHPPGYLLWVLSARAVSAVTDGAMQAQIVVAFLMALLALAVFYALARQVLPNQTAPAWTLLLAFSPAVALHSSIPTANITDLASSSVAGYLAFLDPRERPWRITACLTALGVLAGFRPSGVLLLAPLIAVAALAHSRYAWRAVLRGTVLGLIAFLAWFVPLALSVGGWRVLSQLNSAQFQSAARETSVFFGATAHRHFGMIAENVLYVAMNLAAWLVALALLSVRKPKNVSVQWRYALWLIPNLLLLFAVHGARAGYWLLSLPPLLLLCASLPTRRTNWLPATIAAVLVSLGISYFPYDRFLSSGNSIVDYLLYRSTPRLALDLEASQHNLDRALRDLERSAAPQPFVCARNLPEAPNIRTVTYDFDYLPWVTPDAAPRGESIWLFDQHGPDAALRQRYQTWRRITGDDLTSLWQASP